mmetsp:Transcript_10734/g.14795  ORF Transcript_10734/g.14795 Transcript_10734/m.14795 type:complete len:269 (-) Transcript_10734:48-854(-)
MRRIKHINPVEAHETEDKVGSWHRLPMEVVDKILFYLADVDMCGYLLIASKSTFKPSEVVYKYLCELIYLKQTSRKKLDVQKWNNSWKNMIINRPRLRTNGFYSLRTMFTKAYNNDAFWEEKRNESIEVRFYRHMRFFDDGRVLYSPNTIEPFEMSKLFEPGLAIPKRIFEGTYSLTGGRNVDVKVKLHYCYIHFELQLLDADDGWIGKHNMLTIRRHESYPLVMNTNHARSTENRVVYSLPINASLRFQRCWSFNSRQHQHLQGIMN